MRYFLALATLALLASLPCRAEDDPHYLFSLSFKNGMTMTRYARPEFVDEMRPDRPVGVNIRWAYDDATDRAGAEHDIEAINQVVGETLDSNKDAVLALSSIRQGTQGVWAFYAEKGSPLASALRTRLAGKTHGPTSVSTGADPAWKAYTDFLARLRDD